jgi:cell division protein FtsB
MNYWVILYRIAWIVVIVAVVVGLVCIFLPRANSFQELQRRKRALQESNARAETRVQQLDENEHRFRTDPEFVERIAREQGMAKPGETIYRFQGTNVQVQAYRP